MADENKNKKKSGLHKEISSIFGGVPLPQKPGASREGGGGPTDFAGPRPTPRGPENPHIPPGPGSYRQFREPGAGGRPAAEPVAEPAAEGPLVEMTRKLFGPRPGVSATRQKVMAVLVPLLLVVLVYLLKDVVLGPAPRPRKPIKPSAASVSKAPAEIEWPMPEPYPADLRDPMELTAEMKARIELAKAVVVPIPAGTTTAPVAPVVEELKVSGIVFSEDNPTAVIGTRIAHVGDVIAGATIVKITRNSVEFEKDGKTWTQQVEP